MDQAALWNRDPTSSLHGMIQADNVGVIGHSLGGFSSLLVGGMPFICDYELAPEQCDIEHMRIADYDPRCTKVARELEDPFSLKDARVKAILPPGPPIFHKDIARNAAELKTPLMIIAGDSKRFEASFPPMWAVYENARGPKHMVLIKQTDHFVIIDFILAFRSARYLFLPWFRAHFTEKTQAYKDYSVSFFDLYLKGSDRGAAVLHVPNQPFVKQVWHGEV